MRVFQVLSVAFLAAASLACSGREPAEERAGRPTSADSTEYAASIFDAAAFDTVSWETHAEAVERGAVVFKFSCVKCHGETGLGDAGFVMSGDTVRPPSFLADDWRFASDPTGLRKEIFTGTGNEGMPHWGLEGLKYRDIDAVAYYITETLRNGG